MLITWILGKDIVDYIRGHKWLILGTLIFTSASSLFAVIPAYLLKPFVDLGMLAKEGNITWEIPWISFKEGTFLGFEISKKVLLKEVDQRTILTTLTLIAFGSVLVRSLCAYLGSLLGAAFSTKVVNKVRIDLFQKFLNLHIGFFHGMKTGELVGRANSDLSVMQAKIAEIITGIIEYPVTASVFILYLLYMNYKLTILMVVFVPVFLGVLKVFGKKVKKHAEKVQDNTAELSQRYHEAITCIKIIQGFSQEEKELKRFTHEASQLYKRIMKWYKWHLGLGPLMDSLAFLSIPGMLILGKVVFGHTLGEIISIVFAFSRVYGPVKKLSLINNNIKTLQGSMKRIFEILRTKSEITETNQPIHLQSFNKAIEFKDVWFGYDKTNPVLKGVSFRVHAGEMMAIVGSTGAGKSTLIDLIPRFYDVTRGAILLDGIDIRNIPLKDLRQKIGIVTQDTILFNDTIANNIRYGAKEKTIEDVTEAARLALAHEFIISQPQGYDTVIGDRGVKLSGGQRQRIAIARALITKPSILLLDEAASALDAESDKMIQETIERLKGKLTIIVVAHRISSILNADVVAVLEQGLIVEMGPVKELLSKNGRFNYFYSLQFSQH